LDLARLLHPVKLSLLQGDLPYLQDLSLSSVNRFPISLVLRPQGLLYLQSFLSLSFINQFLTAPAVLLLKPLS
jgi:hypothetical protein